MVAFEFSFEFYKIYSPCRDRPQVITYKNTITAHHFNVTCKEHKK